MSRLRTVSAVFAAALAVAVLAGCSANRTVFVDEGAAYTADIVVPTVLAAADPRGLSGSSTDDAPELRREALVSLRKQGGTAAQAADVLTDTFANLSPGVPYYVERATFDGVDAFVVAEAIGPKDGHLKDVRVWVIAESGDILFSGTR